MIAINRTCANCCAFSPAEDGGTPECLSLVSVLHRPGETPSPPMANDCCDQHQTQAESDALGMAIGAHWSRLCNLIGGPYDEKK